jgi:hypothetical protein
MIAVNRCCLRGKLDFAGEVLSRGCPATFILGGLFMEIDKYKTYAEMAIDGFDNAMKTEHKDTEPIADYLLRSLGIDYSGISENRKNLFQKNFVYIMCLVIGDLKLINSRLDSYQQAHKKYEKDKSNSAEYHRRKIEYFSELNKYARIEIIAFLQNGLKDYILENEFDALKREEDSDGLTKMFMDRRYKFAYLRDYYDMMFDFSTCVKVNYLPGVGLMDVLKVEKQYLDLRRSDESKYKKELHQLVDDKKVMDEVVARVKNNFHLHKRLEIFEDMASLFNNKHYQSFLSLGLLQLEGMFYDLCKIKFGVRENMGTLVEKVQKSLQGGNEFRNMRYYPYFAFDVPIQRNEIAHKGMIENLNLEESAYNLVLDLNAVATMVKSESFDKFIVFIMIHEKMLKLESDNPDSLEFKKEIYHTLLMELIGNSVIAQDYFWSVLKNPQNYSDELQFYKPQDLPEGHIDLNAIVNIISSMIRQEEFWSELLDTVKLLQSPDGRIPDKAYDFAKKLKNDYIAELTDGAKNKCIELSKLL